MTKNEKKISLNFIFALGTLCFRHTCYSFLLSEIASQIRLLQSSAGVSWYSQGCRAPFLWSHVPGLQNPSPMVSGSQVPGSLVSGFRVLGHRFQVPHLDYVLSNMPLVYWKCFTYEKLAVLCNILQSRFLHHLSWEILGVIFPGKSWYLAKLEKPTVLAVLVSFIQLLKFIFIEHLCIGLEIDLFFKRNYEPLTKDHCPSILIVLSKRRKSIKMSTSASNTEHFFYKTTPSGCLLKLCSQTFKAPSEEIIVMHSEKIKAK